jgi:hypothetical protein
MTLLTEHVPAPTASAGYGVYLQKPARVEYITEDSELLDLDAADPFDGANSYLQHFQGLWQSSPDMDLYMVLKQTRAEGVVSSSCTAFLTVAMRSPRFGKIANPLVRPFALKIAFAMNRYAWREAHKAAEIFSIISALIYMNAL